MAIITITSDWGTTDYYTAAVKGSILSKMPDATIVDITHNVEPFNIIQAGFIIRNACVSFPEGTIHIIAVDTIESIENPHVVVKAFGQYFISTDNGIFSLILDNSYDEAVYIDVPQDTDLYTFIARDRFAKVAVMIAKGEPLSKIGAPRTQLNVGGTFSAVANDNSINGLVMYIDSYDNLITNITKEMFDKTCQGRPFIIYIKRDLYTISKISESFDDVAKLEPVAIFGTHGYLELALNRAKMASLCGVDLNSVITVKFG